MPFFLVILDDPAESNAGVGTACSAAVPVLGCTEPFGKPEIEGLEIMFKVEKDRTQTQGGVTVILSNPSALRVYAGQGVPRPTRSYEG